jgi:glycosyltransferase involved in cell wall biosynthesis
MSNRDIAVIIPVYNAGKTILRALDSVFRQTLSPAEVIIVNDGSTDDSVEVINSSKYKRFVSIISISNSGPSNARNVGIKASKSEFIALIDADDEWIFEDKLKQQVALIESSKEIVLVDTFAKVYWGENKILDMTCVKSGRVFNKLLFKNIVNATSSVLIKRSAIKQAGYFDTSIRFGEDRLLWAFLAKIGEFSTLKEFTVYKENHDLNLTSKGQENYRYRKIMVNKLLSQCNLSPNEVAKVQLANCEDFLLLAYRKRNAKLYRNLTQQVFSVAPMSFIFSRFSILYISSFFFKFLPKR